MAHYVLKDCKAYMNQFDLSGDTNEGNLNYEAEIEDDTTFGNGSHVKKPGLLVASLDLAGFWENAGGDGDTDDALFDEIGTAEALITVAPTDGADGERAFSFQADLARYSPGGSIGRMFAFRVNAMGHGEMIRGTIMATGAKTATGNGTARQLGSVAAGEKVYAALHVLEVSGTTPTLDVKVQSDDASGFASATDRITFAQATAVTSEFKNAAGAITDDWWRVNYTIGGTNPSFTFVVVIGIK